MSRELEARLAEVLGRLDARHREDPAGQELDYALAVSDWVRRLRAQPSAALRVAARASHLGRWRIPRERYPRNRAGYLRWRTDLQRFHADQTAGILRDCGLDDPFVERVRALLLKADLTGDPDTRTLEDALCLVFLESQLADFSRRQPAARLQRILRRTWVKMSPEGRQAALGLELPDPVRELLERALW